MRGLIALVLITALGSGCKDDSESDRSGDGGYSSGGGSDAATDAGGGEVPGDKPLGQLSEADRLEVCEGLRDSVDTDAARRGTCVLGASIAVRVAPEEQALEVCQTQLDACLEVPTSPCGAMMFTEDCTATVDDWTGCLRMASEKLGAFADQMCEQIVAEAASAGDAGVTSMLEDELAACSSMLNACSASEDNPCCTDDDSCAYADNGFCDCPDESWDEADCSK